MINTFVHPLPPSLERCQQKRQDQLTAWVIKTLAGVSHKPGTISLQAISGDASFRRYYRVHHPQGTCIAVDAPPAKENNQAFVDIANCWAKQRINVPVVQAVDLAQGFLLLQDLGDNLLLDRLNHQTADRLYGQALTLLMQIQAQPAEQLPVYDATLLRQELALYPQWFLQAFLGRVLAANEQQTLTTLFDQLIANALAQPQVTVHRDFHARNLMLCSDGQLAVLDFQDAVRGPVLYDPVSLLKDCYCQWPEEQVERWLLQFTAHVPTLQAIAPTRILKWFHWLGLQRHLKCLGIFARLYLRDGKSHYLPHLRPVLDYVLAVCRRYPALTTYGHWLADQVVTRLATTLERIQQDTQPEANS